MESMFKYESVAGESPIFTASSQEATCKDPSSMSEYTATVCIPIELTVRAIRQAISPLFAINIFWIILVFN
jgi:hypothetical protein